MTVEFRILGPLEVLRDGESVDLGPHKQRALLALLLLHANRVIPTDRILEELWGDQAVGKENSLWGYISRLRGILEADNDQPEVLTTRDHGYVLNVEADAIDAVRFERDVARGRSLLLDDAEGASAVLREALTLWRGSALQDFTYDQCFEIEIIRLEEMRTGAVEDAVEADLRRGRAGELVGEIESLHETHPLREQPVSQLMLALYRAGRSAEALRTFERFRRTIGEELGIDPSPELCRLEEQILLHDSRLQLRRTTPGATVLEGVANPFRGLRPFSEEDAAVFFGRDRLTAEMVLRLSEDHRLITLIGPSGSGKSSAVRAGLIPAIRKGAVPGSDRWLIAHMLPGSDPFIELEAALLRSTIDTPDSLTDQLRADDGSGLMRAALRILPSDSSRLLLIIDQFEELFTLVESEDVRRRFLDQLVAAVDDTYGRVSVVVTLRADFYRRSLDHAAFATRMGAGVVNVVPLAPDELEAAALEPARHSRAILEPALLAALVADVIGQPGALPAFQYTLTELFDRRVGETLTYDAYCSMGGVRGSLTRNADDLFEQLDDGEQAVAKQLLLRLVAVTENDDWSRRRVPAAELAAIDVDIVAMEKVIETFARQRLLSLDRNLATGAPTVEVAHEALLTEWTRLREWIEQNRDELLLHRELAGATSRWLTSDRDSDYVYSGGRLDEALRWTRLSEIALTTEEQRFLEAGLARREAEGARERERRVREQRLERTARWRTRGLVAAAAVLVVVLGSVGWVATRSPGPKIALVYEGVKAGTPQELILAGWEQATRDLGFDDTVVTSLIDPGQDMRDLAEAGYELVIYGGYEPGVAAAYEAAADMPDTTFLILDGGRAAGENVTTLGFAREGGAYLMGVAAALRSETGSVGFIGGRQTETTEARRAAFTAGARSIDPAISVDAVYLGPFRDADWAFLDAELAYETAADMYRSNVDVIHHSAGMAGFSIGAAAADLRAEVGRELWVIGTEVDERLKVPEYESRYLTSMWKRWDRAVYESVRAFLEGELTSGRFVLGLQGGFVGYTTEGGLTPSDIAVLEAVETEMIDGRLTPPSSSAVPPRWTLEPDTVTALVFDGDTCSVESESIGLVAGSVVRVDVVNETARPVTVAIGIPSKGVDVGTVQTSAADPWDAGFLEPLVSTLTGSGARNALAARLPSGMFFVDCLAEDGSIPGTEITARFETACEGPAPESSDPVDVLRALGAAINARDAAAVCSLFAEDAPVPGEVMAEQLTPPDDDRWTLESVASDIVVDDGEIAWTVTVRGVTAEFEFRLRAQVVNGKFLWIEPVGE